MMVFYIGAAMLLILAVIFIFWPFLNIGKKTATAADLRELTNVSLYRDHLSDIDQSLQTGAITQEQYEQLKTELERNLLEDSQASVMDAAPVTSKAKSASVLVGIVVALCVASAYIYTQLGAYGSWQVKNALDTRTALEEQYFATRDADLVPQITAAGRDLAEKLTRVIDQHPDNLQMHALLARTAVGLEDFDLAIKHFQLILVQEPELSQIMAELAQAMFLKANNIVPPMAQSLVEDALALDAENTVALSLAGIAAFQSESYEQAIVHWRKAIALQNPQSQNTIALQRGIVAAQQRLGIDPTTATVDVEAPADNTPAFANTVKNPSITVTVTLADNVDVEPETTVFIYARAWEGAKVPLSIARLQVSQLPTTLTLTNAMSMAPAMNLNTVKAVELVARVSKAGTPVPQAGDWQATLGPVEIIENNTQPYTLMIADKVL